MNDEGIAQGPGRGRAERPVAPPPDAPSDEALQSLERLEALGGAPPQRPRPSVPVRRPRMPSVPRGGLSWPRFVAPVAFLAAVLIVFSLAVQSGVLNDSPGTTVPQPKASGKAKPSASQSANATYKFYKVKSGDSLSAIADKFDTTVTDLEELNPKADLTTLQVGQKIKVPR